MKGCIRCYEVDPEYHELKNDTKVCEECGGKVLEAQELMDYIADLKERLRFHAEINGVSLDEDFDSL